MSEELVDSKLTAYDLNWCVKRLPKDLRALMMKHPLLTVAGGFIRSCIAREPIADIDLFTKTKEDAKLFSLELPREWHRETENAFTVRMKCGTIVQFIHRWTFEHPQYVVPSFDFTIARAAFWYDYVPCPEGQGGTEKLGKWKSLCDRRFYPDLAAKRLVYCKPVRNEDAGGSVIRSYKFAHRGYHMPLESLGAVIARLISNVDFNKVDPASSGKQTFEERAAFVITGLLREVDPAIDSFGIEVGDD